MSETGKRLIKSANQANEMAFYFKVCQDSYPGDFECIQDMKGDVLYSNAQLDRACSEVAYIRWHNKLADWATVVESFEMVEGSFMFIYHDPIEVL